MIEPQVHVVAISGLALVAAIVCFMAGRRLRLAGLVLAQSFFVVITGQLVFGMVAPALTVLTAVCDMVTLAVIGWALIKARQRAGLHLAGFAMCVSLMSHVAYHVIGISHNATLTYFVLTNAAMVMACLGLIWSGAQAVLVRNNGFNRSNPDRGRVHSWNSGMAARRKAGR
jgi:hypothetical protein